MIEIDRDKLKLLSSSLDDYREAVHIIAMKECEGLHHDIGFLYENNTYDDTYYIFCKNCLFQLLIRWDHIMHYSTDVRKSLYLFPQGITRGTEFIISEYYNSKCSNSKDTFK